MDSVNPTMFRFAVGVDPGVTTGIAIWNIKEKTLMQLESKQWWDAFDFVAALDKTNHLIVVEDTSKYNFTYSRHGADVTRRISRNAGMNQGLCRLMILGLRRLGFTVCEVAPRRRKVNQELFEQYTRWSERTSQHERDAAMLVVGL